MGQKHLALLTGWPYYRGVFNEEVYGGFCQGAQKVACVADALNLPYIASDYTNGLDVGRLQRRLPKKWP